MPNEIATQEATRPTTTPPSTSEMLVAAIEKGMDAQSMQILANIHFQFEAQRAEREFNAALVAFQAECPVILKAKMIEFPTKRSGKFKSHYAEMNDIVEQTKTLREKHNFSFLFRREISKEQIAVFCEVRHTGGHKEQISFSVPTPTDFLISEQHSYAGAITFCERYAFRAAFGITTGMPDDDGKAFIGKIPPEQVAQLRALVEETLCQEDEAFWRYAGVQTLEEIPPTDFARVWQALQVKKRNMEKAQRGGAA